MSRFQLRTEDKGCLPRYVLEDIARNEIVLLGRSKNCEIYVPFSEDVRSSPERCKRYIGISRTHARLTKGNDCWAVQDMQSKNGTYVNGKILRDQSLHRLELGDIIAVGDGGGVVEFVFEKVMPASDNLDWEPPELPEIL